MNVLMVVKLEITPLIPSSPGPSRVKGTTAFGPDATVSSELNAIVHRLHS